MKYLGSTSAEASLLMIALAAALTVLAAHVALGWLQEAMRRTGLTGPRLIALGVAAVAMGSGLCAASALVLAGEALPFQIGYRSVEVLQMWAGGIAGSLLIGLLLLHSPRWWSVTIAGLLLAGMALGIHVVSVEAVGFRPGVTWDSAFVIAAALLLAIGCCSGLWLAWTESGRNIAGRGVWRLGAPAVIGLSIVTAMEVLDGGLGLPLQVGSVYARQLPGAVASLLAGVLLPLVLTIMAIDLGTRRRQRRQTRRHSVTSLPYKGRRRRYKVPTL